MIKKLFKFVKIISIPTIACVLLANCEVIGPKSLPNNRMDYNTALHNSDNQQFLLNIVRMRYGEGPYFIGVNSITSQIDLFTSTGTLFSYSNTTSTSTSGFTSLSQATPFASFDQRPTITYLPLQGTEFVSRLLEPLTIKNLYLLLRSGWSVPQTLRLTVQRVGNLDNASSASRSISSYVPEFKGFTGFSYSLGKLERDKIIGLALVQYKERPALQVRIHGTDAQAQIAKELHLSKPYQSLILTDLDIHDATAENILTIRTRSFLGMLYYLSKAVDVSQDGESLKAGFIDQTPTDKGEYFNWNEVTKNVFQVSISKDDPKDSISKVYYEGKWFYIGKGDHASKTTLVLLGLIFSLQSGEIKGVVPIVTIPS